MHIESDSIRRRRLINGDDDEVKYCCTSVCGTSCSAKDVRFYLGDALKFVITFGLTFAIVYYDMKTKVDTKVTEINYQMQIINAGSTCLAFDSDSRSRVCYKLWLWFVHEFG